MYVSMLLSPCLTHNESSVNTATIVFLAQGIKGGFPEEEGQLDFEGWMGLRHEL